MIPNHVLDNLNPADRVAVLTRGGGIHFLVHPPSDAPEAIRSGRGFADRPWYRAVLAERRSTVTEVFVSLLSNERVVTAVAPIAMIEGGGERGQAVVLAIDVNLDRWSTG